MVVPPILSHKRPSHETPLMAALYQKSRALVQIEFHMQIEKILSKTLSDVGNTFEENELAYLALTTKIELPIRDKWAFTLHNKLQEKYTVAREWKRTDLAVLVGSIPEVLIELKAMYSFDAALGEQGGKRFTDRMHADQLKAKKISSDHTEIYTVLLSTHPKCHIDKSMYGIVKYSNYINRAFKEIGNESSIREKCNLGILRNLNDKKVLGHGEISGGQAFGVEVVVSYWLVKEK